MQERYKEYRATWCPDADADHDSVMSFGTVPEPAWRLGFADFESHRSSLHSQINTDAMSVSELTGHVYEPSAMQPYAGQAVDAQMYTRYSGSLRPRVPQPRKGAWIRTALPGMNDGHVRLREFYAEHWPLDQEGCQATSGIKALGPIRYGNTLRPDVEQAQRKNTLYIGPTQMQSAMKYMRGFADLHDSAIGFVDMLTGKKHAVYDSHGVRQYFGQVVAAASSCCWRISTLAPRVEHAAPHSVLPRTRTLGPTRWMCCCRLGRRSGTTETSTTGTLAGTRS